MAALTSLLRALVLLLAMVIAAGAARADTVYRFGVPPWQRGQSADDIRLRYRPLLDYLSRVLEARIDLVSASTYREMIDYLALGRVHFGTISPIPYVLCREKNPEVRMLVTELSRLSDRSGGTSDSYEGQIIVRADRTELTRIEDLKGLRFAFVTRESSSGFSYPAARMKSMGIDYRSFFSDYVFTGSHPRVTDAIAAGSVDGGATWDFNANEARAKHGDIFRVLQSQRIPNIGIAANNLLPEAARQALKAALLAVDPALLQGLPTAGYVERPDSFYDSVAAIAHLTED